ncbi:hypothetical protein GV827_22030 [Sulfitobacter sp. JBTF-M27]|uniref:Uncharacterized protein n=1 Tax=Sulfitobacter sediminilitoris TaxID=2698830 RepID=A0A6P0CFY0_9RHOB|nr:hypothetical protein [Sulfitobacter sediminilitoris]NEK25049.1 hypothetical protein [Sulfitobacter sediminilitoris]
MQDDGHHWGDASFEDFVEQELLGLAARAQEKGICIDCLSDRLILEFVVGLVRSGVAETEVLNIVHEAFDEAEAEALEVRDAPPRVH